MASEAESAIAQSPLLKLVFAIGVPAAIAVYLVWVLAGDVRGEVRNISDEVKAHKDASAAMQKTLDRQEYQQNIMIELLKLNCVQTGKNAEDRRACYEASRRDR